MPEDVLTVRVEVVDQASKPVQNIRNSFSDFFTEVRKEGLAMVFVGQQFRQWGKAATDSIEDVINKTAAFDKALVQFSVLATNSATSAKGMSDEIVDLAIRYGESAVKVAEGAREIAAAGLDAEASLRLTGIAIQLAVGGLADMQTASSALINTIRQFGLSLKDAGHIADVLANTANETMANVQDLAIALGYVGPIAAQAGMSIEEIAAAIGLLRNSGLEASIAGTNLRQMLVQLLSPTKEAMDAMLDAGLSIRVETEETVRLRTELEKTRAAILGIEREQVALRTSTEDAQDAVAVLRQEYSMHQDAIAGVEREMSRSNPLYGELKKEADSARDSLMGLEFQMRGLTSVMDDTGDAVRDNNIAIMEIEAKARAEGRDLTEEETAAILQLKNANEDLRLRLELQRREADDLKESMVGYEEAMANATAKTDAMKASAVSLHENAMVKLEGSIGELDDVVSGNTKTMRDNEKEIRASEKSYKALNDAYAISGGELLPLSEIIIAFEAAMKGMSVAQRDSFLNTMTGIRGLAAYNLLLTAGVPEVERLTKANEESSEAFDGVGVAAHSTSEMSKNLQTNLDRVREKGDETARTVGKDLVPAFLSLRTSWADSVLWLARGNVTLAGTLGVLGQVVGTALQLAGSLLSVVPALIVTRDYWIQKKIATDADTASLAVNSSASVTNTEYTMLNTSAKGSSVTVTLQRKAALDSDTAALGANQAAQGASTTATGAATRSSIGLGLGITALAIAIPVLTSMYAYHAGMADRVAEATARASKGIREMGAEMRAIMKEDFFAGDKGDKDRLSALISQQNTWARKIRELKEGGVTDEEAAEIANLELYIKKNREKQATLREEMNAKAEYRSENMDSLQEEMRNQAITTYLEGLRAEAVARTNTEFTNFLGVQESWGFAWDDVAKGIVTSDEYLAILNDRIDETEARLVGHSLVPAMGEFAAETAKVNAEMAMLVDLLEIAVRNCKVLEECLTGHSLVPAFDELGKSLQAAKDVNFNAHLDDITMASRVSEKAAFPAMAPVAGGGATLTGGSDTTTINRSTTNSPTIVLNVSPMDWNDPKVLASLEMAVKKIFQRA